MASSQNNPDSSFTSVVADLDAAAERLGGWKLLKKVAILFRENAPRHLEDMQNAIQSSDNKLLEMSAHTFVSSIAYLAAEAATELALVLEQMGRAGDLQGSQEAYDALLEEIGRLEEVLHELSAEED